MRTKGLYKFFYCPECGNITKSKQEYEDWFTTGLADAEIICEGCGGFFYITRSTAKSKNE